VKTIGLSGLVMAQHTSWSLLPTMIKEDKTDVPWQLLIFSFD